MSRKPKFIKPNGAIQRSDTALNKKIATALLQLVLSGQKLFPPSGYLLLDTGEQELKRLPCKTLNAWIYRNNVIPETGLVLRDVLDKARSDYRSKLRAKKQEEMLEQAETKLNRAIALRTTVPIRNMFGQLVYDDEAKTKLARRESVGLLRAQIDAAKYLTERLDPTRYGKVDRTENKHLVFSLADLRREKMKAQTNGNQSGDNSEPQTDIQ